MTPEVKALVLKLEAYYHGKGVMIEKHRSIMHEAAEALEERGEGCSS